MEVKTTTGVQRKAYSDGVEKSLEYHLGYFDGFEAALRHFALEEQKIREGRTAA